MWYNFCGGFLIGGVANGIGASIVSLSSRYEGGDHSQRADKGLDIRDTYNIPLIALASVAGMDNHELRV